jgi:hypothetical protein
VRGYVFRFYSSDRTEPPHVHVRGNGGGAKIWLTTPPSTDARGYDRRRVEEVQRVASAHREQWLEAWARFFER